MSEAFIPPQIQVPSAPSGGDGSLNQPQFNQSGPSHESQSQWTRSVSRSVQIRGATSSVIKTRAQFKSYLQQNGMDLYTSAVEFQHSGDFIMSSYIIYKNHNNFKEPLNSFLRRYPQLQQPVIAIRNSLKPIQSQMNVITPKQNPGNYYNNF